MDTSKFMSYFLPRMHVLSQIGKACTLLKVSLFSLQPLIFSSLFTTGNGGTGGSCIQPDKEARSLS